MSLDSLNQEATNTEATDGYSPHPLGSFEGSISEVKDTFIKDKPVFVIKISTSQGTVDHLIWKFSDEDINNFDSDLDLKDKMLKRIGLIKGTFKTLGLAIPNGWSGGPDTIVSRISNFVGCKCRLIVKQNQNNPDYTVTFINKSTGQPDQIFGPAPTRKKNLKKNKSDNYNQDQFSNPSLDDLPF